MSEFKISVECIDKVWSHPNADRLDLASLQGMSFQFVVAKDSYKAGDRVIYFPVDSLLPDSIIETLGLTGKLSGNQKNRVKTVKLRGAISQGVVAPASDFLAYGINDATPIGTNISEVLGIVKYEPEPVSVRDGRLVPLPQLVQKYDIEGADRYPNIIEMLLNEEVVITEKIEGSHFSISLYADGDCAVCQRNFRILANEGALHDWHKVAEDMELRDKLGTVFAFCGAKHVVTLRGEMVGPSIQGNIYGLSKRRVVFFEMELDGIPVSPLEAVGWFRFVGLEFVPVLEVGVLRDLLMNKTVQELSTGYTILPEAKEPEKTLREGIVIRPITERHDVEFGRVIIKQRSPEYLAKSDF